MYVYYLNFEDKGGVGGVGGVVTVMKVEAMVLN